MLQKFPNDNNLSFVATLDSCLTKNLEWVGLRARGNESQKDYSMFFFHCSISYFGVIEIMYGINVEKKIETYFCFFSFEG